MGRRVVAFAPGHISGYFQRIDGTTTGSTGSIGAGIVINRGVTLTMTEGDSSCISVKNSDTDGWLIKEVLRTLGVSASVTVDAAMPIGAGFGMSAAGLLAEEDVILVAANYPETMGAKTGEYILLTEGAEHRVSGEKDAVAREIWDAVL